MIDIYDFMVEVLDYLLCKKCVKKFEDVFYFVVYDGYFNCIKDLYLFMFFSDVMGYIGLYYIGICLFGLNKDLGKNKCR